MALPKSVNNRRSLPVNQSSPASRSMIWSGGGSCVPVEQIGQFTVLGGQEGVGANDRPNGQKCSTCRTCAPSFPTLNNPNSHHKQTIQKSIYDQDQAPADPVNRCYELSLMCPGCDVTDCRRTCCQVIIYQGCCRTLLRWSPGDEWLRWYRAAPQPPDGPN